MNIAECLILHTCGDYIPFDIRYALVKWVFGAFLLQYTCADAHMYSEFDVIYRRRPGFAVFKFTLKKEEFISSLLPPAKSQPHKSNLISFRGPD